MRPRVRSVVWVSEVFFVKCSCFQDFVLAFCFLVGFLGDSLAEWSINCTSRQARLDTKTTYLNPNEISVLVLHCIVNLLTGV